MSRRAAKPLWARRRFVAVSAAGGAAVLAGVGTRVFAGQDEATGPRVTLVNESGRGAAFAYIAANLMKGQVFEGHAFLDPATGRLVPVPNPSADGQDLSSFLRRFRIPFGQALTLRERLISGRVWFALDSELPFSANRHPGRAAGLLVQPAPGTPSDPTYEMLWDYCEFTYDQRGITANISMVDAVGLPLALRLEPASGPVQQVGGVGPGGTARLARELARAGGDWAACPVHDKRGRLVRVTSPAKLDGLGTRVFRGHYADYVDQVWDRYREGRPGLRIALGEVWPGTTVTGNTSGDRLVFRGVSDGSPASFPRPGTHLDPQLTGAAARRTAEADIFGCDGSLHAINATQQGRIAAVLGAAFARSTLLEDGIHPDTPERTFYRDQPVHHYSRLVHEIAQGGRGYAFAFDDVSPAGGKDLSGTVFHYREPDRWHLTVTLHSPGTAAAPGKPAPAALAAPTGVTVLSRTGTTATVSWQGAAGAAGYEVSLDGRQAASVTATTATLSSLRPGRDHRLTVRSRARDGRLSPPSAPVTIPAHPATGGGTGRPAAGVIAAAAYTRQSGTRVERSPDTSPGSTGRQVSAVSAGDWLHFARVDFGTAPARVVRCRLASGAAPGVSGGIEFRLGGRTGTKIAEIDLSSTGGWAAFTTVPMNLSRPVTGIHELYLTFIGSRADFVNLDWFRFDRR
ncbi:beta-1,3-glucanase family protein [Streptomyces sp. NPDC046887]|uniref:beta-1,3-glucanase family protein n=1 Tax=Streptomyces sp. NPDC046887 TaxID=3155472 RepID=UPI0033F6ABAB